MNMKTGERTALYSAKNVFVHELSCLYVLQIILFVSEAILLPKKFHKNFCRKEINFSMKYHFIIQLALLCTTWFCDIY